MEKVACPECGDAYENVSMHWSKGSCSPPEFTQKQWEILTGIVMGDASVHPGRKTPKVLIQLTVKEYLDYLDEVFGILSTGVKLYKTGQEQGERVKKSGFSPNADPSTYSDVYQWHTRTHESLSKLREWYVSGSKTFPEDIELTPTVLKHWYVCDGYLHEDKNRLVISVSNEYGNQDKLDAVFSRAGLPTPTYDVQTRKDGSIKCNARWNVGDIDPLLNYMGEPLPGFEYKWVS